MTLVAVIAGCVVVTRGKMKGESSTDCVGRLFKPAAYGQIVSSQILKEVIMTVGGA